MRSFAISFFFGALAFAPLFAFANIAPVADPGGPYQGTTDVEVVFNGSNSYDEDGDDDLTYSWDFDNSNGIQTDSDQQNPTHAYAETGMFVVSLTVDDGTATDTKTTTALISVRAPKTPEPESGAPFISFPFMLGWEDVPEAQSYRYELIGYEENGVPKEFLAVQSQSNPFDSSVLAFLEPWHLASWYRELDKCDKNGDEKCADTEVRTFIKDQQRRLWHARSCKDTEGTVCGPWGAVWDFTYLLGPPMLESPAAGATGVSVQTPLDWNDVPGANSYEIFAGPCPSWMEETETEAGAKRECYTLTAQESRYEDDECFFTRNTLYAWQVASCLDEGSQFCGPESAGAYFTTGSSADPLFAPTFLKPPLNENEPPPKVSWQDSLSWNGPACGSFYQIRFTRDDGEQTEFSTPLEQTESVKLSGDEKDIWERPIEIRELKEFWRDASNLNRTFAWTVTPCWKALISGVAVADCTGTTASAPAQFQTAGALPILSTPADGSSTKIPILLSWQGDGASYVYEVSSALGVKTGTAKGTSETIGYEQNLVEPGQEYAWRVKTCVDEDGAVCGPWSEAFTFTTFELFIPDTPNPLDGGTIQLDQQVSWKNVDAANAYAYHLEYACRNEKENKEECVAYGTNVCPDTSAIKIIEDNKVTTRNSFELPYCMGQYEWKALACLQDKCQDPSETRTEWSNGGAAWKLTALQPLSAGVGLVPCGRLANDDATPYDETEKCGLQHLGFLLQNLLDFILWKLSLATILVLSVITGATSYFSLGGPNALARMKTVFRSFFVGFLILMFAWMFVNIILMLFGFEFEFFGKWWELSF